MCVGLGVILVAMHVSQDEGSAAWRKCVLFKYPLPLPLHLLLEQPPTTMEGLVLGEPSGLQRAKGARSRPYYRERCHTFCFEMVLRELLKGAVGLGCQSAECGGTRLKSAAETSEQLHRGITY